MLYDGRHPDGITGASLFKVILSFRGGTSASGEMTPSHALIVTVEKQRRARATQKFYFHRYGPFSLRWYGRSVGGRDVTQLAAYFKECFVAFISEFAQASFQGYRICEKKGLDQDTQR